LKLKHEPQEDDSFEKLLVWQRAQTVAVRVSSLLASCRDFGFRNQMTDSANSISNHIAAGAERLSRAEFRQFLGYAKGSAGETRSRSYTAEEPGCITSSDSRALHLELKEISRMIRGLIRSLDRNDPRHAALTHFYFNSQLQPHLTLSCTAKASY
jgi:four helix bundle protein